MVIDLLRFKIPKRFKLFGYTINVIQQDNLVEESDNVGEAHYRTHEIALQSQKGIYSQRPPEYYEETFFHELVHWILHLMGQKDLESNHEFVNTFCGLLHQAITTMEYEEETR